MTSRAAYVSIRHKWRKVLKGTPTPQELAKFEREIEKFTELGAYTTLSEAS
ncbi:MAG: hypothetical protein AAFP76_00005 [Bacteroidota bacterium]